MSSYEYRKQYRQKRKREREGWYSKVFNAMRYRSKVRFGEDLPFTKDEFVEWVGSNYGDMFDQLFTDYVASDCEKELCPSIDRFNDYENYTFSNMRLTTWKDNDEKGRYSDKNKESCARIAREYWSKPVLQLSLTGELINEFPSTREAERVLGFVDHSTIAKCCRGVKRTHKGFKWKYKEVV